MKKTLFLISILLTMNACNSHLDKKYNDKTIKEDLIVLESQIDSTELMILAATIFRLKLQDNDLNDMTFDEIIQNGKAWEKQQNEVESQQKQIAEKAMNVENMKTEKLSKAILISCFHKGYEEYDYEEYITYKFAIQNKSDKKVRAFKGSIVFTNLFGDEIKSLNLVYDEPIEKGRQVTYNATTDYNQFIDSDKLLKNKDLEDLKVIWKPEKVIFEDGTTIE